MSSIWDILGIKPTRDKKQIKVAYTNKLKSTNPEEDQEKFKELRSAYESAIVYADHSHQTPRKNHTKYTINIDSSKEKQPVHINRANKNSNGYIKHIVDTIFHHALHVSELSAINAFKKIVRIGILDDLSVNGKVTKLVLYKLSFLEKPPYELALVLFKYLRWDINSLALDENEFKKIDAILDTAKGMRYINTIKRSNNTDRETLNRKKIIAYLESPSSTKLSSYKIRKIKRFLSKLRFMYPKMKFEFANSAILYECRLGTAELSLNPPARKKRTGKYAMIITVVSVIFFMSILARIIYIASTPRNYHYVATNTVVTHERDNFLKKIFAIQRMKDNDFNLGLQAQKEQHYKQAIAFYTKAALFNDYAAMLNLGNIYLQAMHNQRKAIYWYKKATQADDNSSGMAFYNLGQLYYDKNEFNKAINYFKKSYKKGYQDPHLYLCLGRMTIFGQGVKRNVGVGLYWIKKSARDNNLGALAFLADAYYEGNYVKRDFSKALKYYRALALKGDVVAQYNLGLMYYHGQGTSIDYNKSFIWYKKSAMQGHRAAQSALVFMYYNGKGTPKNYHAAFKWAKKAAAQRDPVAQEFLGDLYRAGEGTQKNDCLAVHWYRQSAIQGDAVGQNNLGVAYLFGICVKPDRNKAYQWIKTAADNGSKTAKRILKEQF